MFDRILVVCVGNICRSPMGEALLARELAYNSAVRVSSAGIGALVDRPADPTAQALMREQGLDISAHRAQQLTSALLRRNDLVLVMESGHKKAVETIDPSARGKVYRWGEWGDFDVPDPFGESREVFEQALALLLQGLKDWSSKLKG